MHEGGDGTHGRPRDRYAPVDSSFRSATVWAAPSRVCAETPRARADAQRVALCGASGPDQSAFSTEGRAFVLPELDFGCTPWSRCHYPIQKLEGYFAYVSYTSLLQRTHEAIYINKAKYILYNVDKQAIFS